MNTSFNFGFTAVQLKEEVSMAEIGKKGAPAANSRKGNPPDETMTAKLARLANKRVNKAVTQIRLIGNLGAYSPNAAQVEMIVKYIDEEVAAMKDQIKLKKPIGEGPFNLA
jgi:hypothetical protein